MRGLQKCSIGIKWLIGDIEINEIKCKFLLYLCMGNKREFKKKNRENIIFTIIQYV